MFDGFVVDLGDHAPAMSEETQSMTPSPSTMDPAANLVGPGCAAYAEAVPSGSGSVEGMSQAPVATAASNNPLLKTLVAAVSGQLNPDVNLVDTLNGSQFTVFAPVDDAFAKIDAATIDSLKTDSATLTKILTYHVVPASSPRRRSTAPTRPSRAATSPSPARATTSWSTAPRSSAVASRPPTPRCT
jgi:uncharacterized surface protein with fasciclin (FAS1) repeats